jgi:glycosyltransferase involved in cell wall biosynthesis
MGASPEHTVIVQVGRMESGKGQVTCIEALARLRDRSDWLCWQIGGAQTPGEAQYFDELRDLAHRLGVAERIRFLGERRDVHRLLAAADVYCQPNTKPEAFGLTFVEALAAGLPVVTTSHGGGLEIVTDRCGVLVTPGDAQELAAALRRLIDRPELRATLAAHGRGRREELCDPRRQMTRIAAILEHVATNHVVH